MADHYVSTAGNDGWDGTTPEYVSGTTGPWLTIEYADGRTLAGETCYIRAGTYLCVGFYVPQSGTAEDRITFDNYQDEVVIIDAADTYPASHYNGYVLVEGDYVTIRDVTIKASNGVGLYMQGDFNYAINVKIDGSREGGIYNNGNYGLIDCCTATETGRGYGIDGQTSWGNGIGIRDGTGTTIQHCVTYNNRGEGLCIGPYSTNGIIDECTSYDNEMVQLYLLCSTDSRASGNLCYFSSDKTFTNTIGISLGNENNQEPSGTIIENNLVYGCWLNFRIDANVTEATGLKVRHNTFVNIRTTQTLIDAGYDMNVYLATDASLVTFSDSLFKNNIVIEENAAIKCINSTMTTPHVGFDFDYNCWSKAVTAAAQGANDVVDDPEIAKTGLTTAGNMTGAYFKIGATSPAKDAGTDVGTYTDYFGNLRPVGAAHDIGAHEYVAPGYKIQESFRITKT